MENDKYITLDANLIKYENTLKAIATLEECQGRACGERRAREINRRNKTLLRKTERNLKRLVVVIKKQSKNDR